MNFGYIYIKIIPFFLSIGVESLYFVDWVKEAEYTQAKYHLTREGLNKILEIKSNMNKGRVLV